MKIVIFGRHGQAAANAQGLLAGSRTNSDLTELGTQQAHELAKNLVGRDIKLIVSSPLSRAMKTAEIVASDIGYVGDILVDPLFTERDFGTATGRPTREAFAMLDSGEAEGMESTSDFAARIQRALEWLKVRSESEILLISHAGFGQMLGTIAGGGRAEDFLQFDNLSNGNMFELTLG
jgi:uncharacterized phosphatase